MGTPDNVLLEKPWMLQMAVTSLLHQIDAITLQAIVASGRDEFIRVARTEWTGHGFTGDDYREAFRQLRQRASQVSVVGEQTHAT